MPKNNLNTDFVKEYPKQIKKISKECDECVEHITEANKSLKQVDLRIKAEKEMSFVTNMKKLKEFKKQVEED